MQNWNHLPTASSSSQTQLHSWFPYLLPAQLAQGDGCCNQFIKLHFGHSFLTPFCLGSLPWATVLHKLLQHGSFPWAARYIQLLWCGVLHSLQCGYLHWCHPSRTAGGQPVSPWSSPCVTWKSLLGHLEHLLLSFFTDLGASRVVSLTFFSLLSITVAAQHFLLFLSMLSQKRHQHHSLAQLCPVLVLV